MKDIQLRPSTLLDAGLLLEWRNHHSTRVASLNSSVINWEDHINWFDSALNDSNRSLYIAEIEGIPVGTIRTDLVGHKIRLSWTVAPGSRNKGIAKLMVLNLVKRTNNAVFAEIKNNNVASIRIAEYAGLTYKGESNGIACYGRNAL